MDGVITEVDIYNLYRKWCEEKGKFERHPCRIAKNPKKTSKAIWTVMTKLAAMLEGSPVEPSAYMRACLTGINNCKPGHLISQRGVDAFERFFNLQTVDLDNPVKEIDRSLKQVQEFCLKNNIQFSDYLFFCKGKTKVAVLHLDIKTLSPYLLLVMPRYEEFLQFLDSDERDEVTHNVASAYYTISKNSEKYVRIREALRLL